MSDVMSKLGVNLVALAERQMKWSHKTFGARGPKGPLKHLSKEALEAAQAPYDTKEYADCLILLLDAIWRSGMQIQTVVDAAHEKMTENENRQWPASAANGGDEPVEHVRTAEELAQKFAEVAADAELQELVDKAYACSSPKVQDTLSGVPTATRLGYLLFARQGSPGVLPITWRDIAHKELQRAENLLARVKHLESKLDAKESDEDRSLNHPAGSCASCDYYVFLGKNAGACARYPRTELTYDENFCGEWRAKDDA